MYTIKLILLINTSFDSLLFLSVYVAIQVVPSEYILVVIDSKSMESKDMVVSPQHSLVYTTHMNDRQFYVFYRIG